MAMTVVSATMVDSDGTAWIRGSWKLEFVPTPSNPNLSQYQVDGASPLLPSVLTQNGVMDNSGHFSVSLYDNTSITPVGSSWKLTVCPLSSAQCGIYVFGAAGPSLDISGALTFLMPPPRFVGVYPNYGYADLEVIPSNKPGSTYYNVTQQVQKYYNDQTQTWAIVGTGPAGPPGTPSATPPVIITTPSVDLNTLTTSGIYYIEQGTGNATPSNATNSDMAVLEVFAHTAPISQSPYILQRLWLSQDSWSGASPGRWYFRWNWNNSGTQLWTPWFIYEPIGTDDGAVVTTTFTNNIAAPTLNATSGVIKSNSTMTITALNIFNQMIGSGNSSGILCVRDDTLGGAALFLVDPNAPSQQGQLIGTSQITGLGAGCVQWGVSAGTPWAIQLTSGSVPRTLSWGFLTVI